MSPTPDRLDLEGELALEVAGEPFALRAAGDRAELRAADLFAARGLLRSLPARAHRRPALHRLAAALRRADVELALRVGSHQVASLGRGGRPGLLPRLLGVAPATVSLPALWRCWRESLRSGK